MSAKAWIYVVIFTMDAVSLSLSLWVLYLLLDKHEAPKEMEAIRRTEVAGE